MDMSMIEDVYVKRTPKSAELAAQAKNVIAGGETRAATYHRPYSWFATHASGPRIYDVDGNEYLDVNNNYTCLIHGHAFEPVVRAVRDAAGMGTLYCAKNRSEIELAELIVDRVASVEAVRFTNSGLEGVQAALEIARGYTGRTKIMTSTFSYHGFFLGSPRAADADARVPRRGIGSGPGEWVDTYVGEWGNAESFERILAEHGREIAIVMLEPWLGNGGMVGAPKEFFARVQAAAKAAGAVFCLDEATVFRLNMGGAQALLGIAPDLTVLGKIVGGGLPGGGVGGRRDLMDLASVIDGKVVLSGTFWGNPVTMAAGLASMRELTAEKIDKMAEQTKRIESALARSAARYGLPFSSRRVGSLMNMWLTETAPRANQIRTDREAAALFHLACSANGLLIAPRSLMNVSTAMTDNDVTEVIERFDSAMADVAAEL
jgi:glutamate-1-semialdehyde 2,1-aminomutase